MDFQFDNQIPYFTKRLHRELAKRQRETPGYSLRAFSRYLQIDPSWLSAILRNKRKLPLCTAQRLAERMNFSPEEKVAFLQSAAISGVASTAQKKKEALSGISHMLWEEDYFHVISEWEHYAVLSLIKTKDFKHDVEWIAGRLGISKTRAEMVIGRLLECGLLTRKNGKYERSIGPLCTSQDIPSTALRVSHKEALEMGVKKLEDVPVQKRDFSTISMPTSPERLHEAKALIREFRTELSRLVQGENPSEVYQLCVQLYPLTNLEEKQQHDAPRNMKYTKYMKNQKSGNQDKSRRSGFENNDGENQ